MKVFNLGCPHDHRFEGWFASAEAFDTQAERGLIECPVCGSREIRKLLAAPRLNLSSRQEAPRAPASSVAARRGRGRAAGLPAGGADGAVAGGAAAGGGAPDPARLQAMFMTMVRKIVESTEDVGERFTEEARRIHYRESPERAIRGVATPEQTEALRDEGIEVVSLPLPPALKGPLQ